MKASQPKPIRVVIVEDHRMFREQLAHLIGKAEDMEVCGEADNVRDGLDLIEAHRPSVAIVDISLKGSSGLELLKELRSELVDVLVVVLWMSGGWLYCG